MKPVWYKNPAKGQNKAITQKTEILPSPPEVIDIGEPPADGKYEEGGIPVSELGIDLNQHSTASHPLLDTEENAKLVITGIESSVQEEVAAPVAKKPRKKKKDEVTVLESTEE